MRGTSTICLALTLGNTAELYAEVVVPAAARVQVGIAGSNLGRLGEAVQVRVLSRIDYSNATIYPLF